MLKLLAQNAIFWVDRDPPGQNLDCLAAAPTEPQDPRQVRVELGSSGPILFEGGSTKGDAFVVGMLRDRLEKTTVGQVRRLPTSVLDELPERPGRYGVEPGAIVLHRAFEDKGSFGRVQLDVSLDLVFDVVLA